MQIAAWRLGSEHNSLRGFWAGPNITWAPEVELKHGLENQAK